MVDVSSVQVLDLRTRSSVWTLTCAKHGEVTCAIVFNDDIANRAYCPACWEEALAPFPLSFSANNAIPPPEAGG